MRKIIVVAMREYFAAVKTKAFIISVVAVPILWSAMIIAPMALKDKVDISDKRVAVLDLSGSLFEHAKGQADKRNTESIFDGEADARHQVKPRYVLERIETQKDYGESFDLELSDRVRGGEFLAFVIIEKDVLGSADSGQGASIRYHSNSPTYDDCLKWLSRVFNERIRSLRFADMKLDPEVVSIATRRVPVENLGLVSMTDAGEISKAEKTNELANIFVPLGLLMLMFMMIMVGASPLVQSVLEEKMNRIAEVLLASVPPFQLMFGKLIGMVGVSLTLSTLYLVGAYIGVSKAGYETFFPTHVVWWFVVFQILAVLMYGAVFAAIGAAVTDLKEAQSVITPTMMVAVAPMVFWVHVVKEPGSLLSTVLSLVPPMTPALMVLRISVPPGIPLWQPLLGVVLVLLSTVFCVFAAGRVFRIGILMQGKGARVSEMLRWVFRG